MLLTLMVLGVYWAQPGGVICLPHGCDGMLAGAGSIGGLLACLMGRAGIYGLGSWGSRGTVISVWPLCMVSPRGACLHGSWRPAVLRALKAQAPKREPGGVCFAF